MALRHRRDFLTVQFRYKVKPFADFLTEHDEPRIPDPYYGGEEGFAHVIELLEDGCAELLDQLSKTPE